MLAKSKTSSLILSIVIVIMMLAGFVLVPGGPGLAQSNAVPLIFALVLGIISVFFVSHSLVMNTNEAGFGWRGLLRWAAFGLINGLLFKLLYFHLLNRLGEKNLFRSFSETFGVGAIFAIMYWLLFQRSILSIIPPNTQKNLQNVPERNTAWFIFGGGVFMLAAGWVILLSRLLPSSQGKSNNLQLVAVSAILFGLSGALYAGLDLSKRRGRLMTQILVLVASLFLLGLILLLIGLF